VQDFLPELAITYGHNYFNELERQQKNINVK
jgi:hypothetical protein